MEGDCRRVSTLMRAAWRLLSRRLVASAIGKAAALQASPRRINLASTIAALRAEAKSPAQIPIVSKRDGVALKRRAIDGDRSRTSSVKRRDKPSTERGAGEAP
jgi:hypothetical protein